MNKLYNWIRVLSIGLMMLSASSVMFAMQTTGTYTQGTHDHGDPSIYVDLKPPEKTIP